MVILNIQTEYSMSILMPTPTFIGCVAIIIPQGQLLRALHESNINLSHQL